MPCIELIECKILIIDNLSLLVIGFFIFCGFLNVWYASSVILFFVIEAFLIINALITELGAKVSSFVVLTKCFLLCIVSGRIEYPCTMVCSAMSIKKRANNLF